jgi:hypothetical protein
MQITINITILRKSKMFTFNDAIFLNIFCFITPLREKIKIKWETA